MNLIDSDLPGWWTDTRKTGLARRRFRERRAWVGLACSLVFLLLAQAGMHGLLHSELANWRDPFHGQRLKSLRARVHNTSPQPPVLVMIGSSRMYRGFRAARVEEQLRGTSGPIVFNLGKEGSGPIMNLYTWHRLIREVGHPSRLLLEITPFLCSQDIPYDEIGEVHLPSTMLGWNDMAFVEKYSPDRIKELRTNLLVNHCLPWMGYRRVILSRYAPFLLAEHLRQTLSPMVNPSGDGPESTAGPVPASEHPEGKKGARNLASLIQGKMPGRRQEAALREILSACQKRGIPVDLIYAPESATLRELCPATSIEQLERNLKALAREYNARLIDARDWVREEDAFCDYVHLLPVGAEIFTKRLIAEVIEPALKPD